MTRYRVVGALWVLCVAWGPTQVLAGEESPDVASVGAAVDVAAVSEELKGAVRGRRFQHAKGLVTQLASTGDVKASRAIIDYALNGANYGLEKHAGFLLASTSSAAIQREVLSAAVKHKNYKTRIVMVAILARWAEEDPAALRAVHEALEDPRRPVVTAALSWLAKLKREESFKPLIALLAKREKSVRGKKISVKDRIYYDTRKTLKAIFGKDLELVADWKNFWKGRTRRAKRGIPEPPSGREIRRAGGTAVSRESARFFAIPIHSERVFFVIDISTSMMEADVSIVETVPEIAAAGRDAELSADRTGVAPKKKEVQPVDPDGAIYSPTVRVRFHRARRELIRAINSLPASVRFGIMAFSHRMAFWGETPALSSAIQANKDSAVAWVRGLTAMGYTRTDIALGHALSVLDVDTIFLLTDGAPQDELNRRLPVNPILDYVREQNRFLKCRIHTISFKQIRDTRMRMLVEQLAAQNDGTWVYLR